MSKFRVAVMDEWSLKGSVTQTFVVRGKSSFGLNFELDLKHIELG